MQRIRCDDIKQLLTLFVQFCNEIGIPTTWLCKNSNLYAAKKCMGDVHFIYPKYDSINLCELP